MKIAVVLLALCTFMGCGGDSPSADSSGSDIGLDVHDTSDSGSDVTDQGGGEDSSTACESEGETPPVVAETMGVFDPVRRRLVFYSGDDGLPVNCSNTGHVVGVDGLWVYDAVCATFEKKDGLAMKPPPRARGMAVYDADRDQMILFGGRSRPTSSGPYTVYNDVWALNLETFVWTELVSEGPKPVARSNPAGAYNHVTQEMLVFGGNSSTSGLSFSPHDDVWAFHIATQSWREIPATGSRPVARLFHSAAVDVENDHLYVFGGGDANAWQGPFLADLWRFDLSTGVWEELHSGGVGAPAGRIWSTITYDSFNQRVLLFGGHDDGAVGNNNDTWQFDTETNQWSAIVEPETVNAQPNGFCDFPADFTLPNMEAPDRRSAHLAALDPTRGEWVVFGGKTDCGIIDDVWVFDVTRDEWLRLFTATVGESCLRGANPNFCFAMCQ
ncbi:MAG: hypothetical protein CMH54_08785 [Myxococcales bacterium]|nr:hypothetical protein [Myxococcales bacterium]